MFIDPSSSTTEAERAWACTALTSTLASHMFGVRLPEIFSRRRQRARVASARHVAIYLAHVGCGQSMEQVGVSFRRHRTTVRHACGRIEDQRDDRAFDWSCDLLENAMGLYVCAFMPDATTGALQ